MDSQYDRSIQFHVTKQPLRPNSSPDLKIKFNIHFNTENSNYTINPDSGRPCVIVFTSWYYDAALVTVRQHYLSYDDIQEAVGKAIGDRLRDDERSHAIMLACEEVRKAFPAAEAQTLPHHVVLHVDLNIWIRYFYVSVLEMVEDMCCSICFEKPSASGMATLPCSHVFHGVCIEKWLETNHSCPLCRYQMPGCN